MGRYFSKQIKIKMALFFKSFDCRILKAYAKFASKIVNEGGGC